MTTTWAIDAIHSSAEFPLSHMGISTYRGRFRVLAGTLTLDEGNVANTKIDATIDVKSIDVEPGPLLDKLYDADFFDVANNPQIKFTSTKTSAKDDKHLTVEGNLTIRGQTQPVTLALEYLGGNKHPFAQKPMRGYRATTTIDRTAFGMKWNAPLDTGAQYLGEKVEIALQIELLQVG